jgi:hypothetical protein
MEAKWRIEVLSPVNNKMIWSVEARTLKIASDVWESETENDYITHEKLTRISQNRSKNNLIVITRLFKIRHDDIIEKVKNLDPREKAMIKKMLEEKQ